jgi:hypothetical protein
MAWMSFCHSAEKLLSEKEFLSLQPDQMEQATRDIAEQSFSPAVVGNLLTTIRQVDLNPLYRGYVWIAISGSVQPDHKILLRAIDNGSLLKSLAAKMDFSGKWKPDLAFWTALQSRSAIRLAVLPTLTALFDGKSRGVEVKIDGLPATLAIDWAVRAIYTDPGYYVGFGCVLVCGDTVEEGGRPTLEKAVKEFENEIKATPVENSVPKP